MISRISKIPVQNRLFSPDKLHIFSIISLAAIVVIILANSTINFDYSQSFDIFTEKDGSDHGAVESLKTEVQIKSSAITRMPLRSVKEKIEKVHGGNILNPWIPPLNVTEEDRIAWFREKLPGFDIFKSDDLARRFHSRVLEFFNPSCEAQFFMTWISPVESFRSREFLAMESLFNVHPRGCLMILSRSMDSIAGYRILNPLLDSGFKVQAVTPDLSFLFNDTPSETWYSELKMGNKDPGEIPLAQNLSNLMRLAVLYKYGGVYLDTDFIVLRPFNELRNSIGAQSVDGVSKNWTRLNNAVMIFDMKHPLLFKFIQEFALTFNGSKWGHNGPYLVSRVVERVRTRPGFNFTVLPTTAFYPVDWIKIGGLFKKPKDQVESKWVNEKLVQLSESYGVHLWNKQSSRLAIEEGSVMGRLISDHYVTCRNVYSS
ncbi:hypothetical protein FNV43_RR10468 [Rhamnella rubrinervis]|uniref:Alpha 1,4-glycosyltransferase domain-containing protein n=1 Tax=Rhamnella rubrinervis TaxID=2594499 RepID=A0A8K0MKW7_9ROSA|nr:hypothetical protein FNV43_RR10468 [Rhamnella rubrinervis]